MKTSILLLLLFMGFGAIAVPLTVGEKQLINLSSPESEIKDIGLSQVTNPGKGEFAHVVLFWLKNPDNQEEKDRFLTSLETFVKNSKYVKSIHVGSPASTDRPVIDKSYTYMMILTFESKEEQDKYQDEAGHKKFIAESEHLWEKVVVYDSLNMW